MLTLLVFLPTCLVILSMSSNFLEVYLGIIYLFIIIIFFNFYFYFILLYNSVLVLPYIDMGYCGEGGGRGSSCLGSHVHPWWIH